MNLAWKLDLVLAGKVDAQLLDSYQAERSPHVKSIIDLAVQVGKVSCMVDPEAVAQRDKAFRDGDVPPTAPFPQLDAGLIDQGAQAHPVAGQLGPQGRLQHAGVIQRSDDLHGTGWQLIGDFDAWSAISAASRALLEHLSVAVIRPLAEGAGRAGDVIDVDGTYRDYFAQHQLRAVLVRPDFYCFGGVSEPAALDALVGRLGVALGQPTNGQ